MAFLPLFPLNLVAFPGESLNLHIFEPRYIQLINECIREEKTFGIPVYLRNTIMSFGTEMSVSQVYKRYEDGRMDIRTKGRRVFQLDRFINPVPDRLYAGGEVTLLDNTPLPEVMSGLLDRVRKLYHLLQVPFHFDLETGNFSFEVAHKVGLSLDQEYDLLRLLSESERQVFLIRHLEEVLPVVSEMERTKERIRMNGHFRSPDLLNF
ncbi:MAG: LON peptidase substrate-binding domain-containing protein [Siphonobacter aquaeclarae]|nr:LON peptidase substrate-binding domain-containing protein [Siphonobacter aquaeclarae]